MAHQGQIIAFAEFSCSQSEAIKHTSCLMGHSGGRTHRHQNGPYSQVPEASSLPPLCGSTGVGVGELSPGGLRKRRRRDPVGLHSIYLAPAVYPELRKRAHWPQHRLCRAGPGTHFSQASPCTSLPAPSLGLSVPSACLFPGESGASNQTPGNKPSVSTRKQCYRPS